MSKQRKQQKKANKYKKKTKPKAVEQPTKAVTWLHILAILGMVLLQYGNTLWNDYAYDDYPTIIENPQVKQGIKGIPTIWSEVYRVPGTTRPTYRPVPFTTFALEQQFFGQNPVVGHLFNIFYFGLCCVLLMFVLQQIFWRLGINFAFFTTLLFAFHPIHTESVANIKGRDDIFCLIGGLLCLYGLLAYIQKKPHWKYGILSILGFSMGMFSKTTVITFLAIIPLVIFYASANVNSFKQNLWKTAWISLPLCLYPFIYVSFAFAGSGFESVFNEIDNPLVGNISLTERWATTILIWGYYTFKSFIPYPLLCNYGYNYLPFATFADPLVLLSITLFILGGVYTLCNLAHKNVIAFAISFWGITLSIYGNIVMPTPIMMADRFLFIPSLGACLVLVFLLMKINKVNFHQQNFNSYPKLFRIGMSVIILFFFSLTFQRNWQWKDNFTLFSHDYPYLKEVVKANTDMANELLKKYVGNYTTEIEAQIIEYAEKATTIYPSSFTYRVKGVVYLTFGRFAEAEADLIEALRTNPENGRANYFLGMLYYEQKRFDHAIPYLEKAVNGTTPFADKYQYLARAYCRNPQKTQEDLIKAQNTIVKGIKKYPNEIEMYNDATRVFALNEQYEQAFVYAERARKIDPKNPEVYRNLAQIYESIGQLEEAAQYRQKYENLK